MTGVDPSTKYEKPRQDVGVFLLSEYFRIIRIILILVELKTRHKDK